MPKFKRAGSRGSTVTKAGRKSKKTSPPAPTHSRCTVCLCQVTLGERCRQDHSGLMEHNGLPMHRGTIDKLVRAWERNDQNYVIIGTDQATTGYPMIRIEKRKAKKRE